MKKIIEKSFNTREELIEFCKQTDISFVKSAVVTALTRFATKKVANAIDYKITYDLTVQERKNGFAIWFDVRVESLKNSNKYDAIQVLVAIPYYRQNPFVEVIELD